MKIENVNIYDLENCIKASKYPMSINTYNCNSEITNIVQSLAHSNKGEGHDQFLTGIRIAFDLTCSNKMWIEAERYRFLEFVSSQSTMHRITKFDLDNQYNEYVDSRIIDVMKRKIEWYNEMIKFQQEETNKKEINEWENKIKKQYLEILYSNPSGFELTARLTTNYRCLKTIYSQRKNHTLPEWRKFCEWIESLPNARELIIKQ